jgi:L-threonylcarbamoyladenylate synthase
MVRTNRLNLRDAGALELAAGVLRDGDLIALPTDTVYGLGAHAFLAEAVGRLYQVKRRPAQLAIPLLLPDAGLMEVVCTDIPPAAWQIAERHWPGGLSLVLRRAPVIPDAVTAGGPTVAVRMPDHQFVQALCREIGAPIAATSANRHGQVAPVTAGEVEAMLGGRIPLLLDGGTCPGGVASTVLDLTTWPPTILRAGPVTAAQLSAIVPLADTPASRVG